MFLFSSLAKAQEDNFDTLFYSKDTLFEIIKFKWTKSEIIKFELYQSHFETRNRDTVKNLILIDTVNLKIVKNINDIISYEFDLGKKSLSNSIFIPQCMPKSWISSKIPRIEGNYYRQNDSFSIDNCTAIADFIIPNLQESLNCISAIDSLQFFSSMFSSYPEKLKECEFQSKFLLRDLNKILGSDSEIVPVNDSIKYTLRRIEEEDLDPLELNRICTRTILKNGNIKYTFSEDKSKSLSIIEQLMQSLGEDVANGNMPVIKANQSSEIEVNGNVELMGIRYISENLIIENGHEMIKNKEFKIRRLMAY